MAETYPLIFNSHTCVTINDLNMTLQQNEEENLSLTEVGMTLRNSSHDNTSFSKVDLNCSCP